MAMDCHCIKMCLESTQLLHTALHTHGLRSDWMYKPFNPKHPSCRWVAETRNNFMWVVAHGFALCDEYTSRYKKIHKCRQKIQKASEYVSYIPEGADTKQLLAMPIQFQTNDPVHSYRMYYAGAKANMSRSGWKYTPEPTWWVDYRKYVIDNNLEIINEKNDGVNNE
jgi:hypothetical protein